MKKYVLGFAFNIDTSNLILIEKQKPDWQKGKLNGVGGKIEDYDSTPHHAMMREFWEETGVLIQSELWQHFADMVFEDDIMGGSATVHCFRVFDDSISNCRTIEEERIITVNTTKTIERPIIKNLSILIPMALDKDFVFSTLNIR